MAFVEHTLSWVRGELFEAGMLVMWGAGLVLMAAYFWRFGDGPYSRTLIVPFVVVGLLWGVAGGVSLYRNAQRMDAYRAAYQQDPAAFVEQEHERVEGFIGWYRPLMITWTVLTVAGLAAFMVWGGDNGRAVGLGLVLFAVGGLMVDHTSENNAYAYKAAIERARQASDAE